MVPTLFFEGATCSGARSLPPPDGLRTNARESEIYNIPDVLLGSLFKCNGH